MTVFGVPGRRVARMADQLSVSQPTPCKLQALSGGLQVLDPDGGGLKVDVATGRMAKTTQTARTCLYGYLEERNASEPAVIPRVG